MVLVAVVLPCGDFVGEDLLVGDAAIQTLRRENAEFWINFSGRMIHIRYFALRDEDGSYRGTLEVTQDITGIRALEGERRLLDMN